MAGKIPSTFIDELIGRVDIVDIIDRRVPLTRKGKEYQACCPFHDEKTPSFTVSPTKQFYHCFGCGAHGTAIGFLMEYANLGFVEAVEELADSVAIEVPREAGSRQPGPDAENPPQLLETISQANTWFQQQLRQHRDAKQAIAYLKGRGLDGTTASNFGIGFAPESWDGLANALGKDQQALQQMVKAGLVTPRKPKPGEPENNGDEHSNFYDRFRGRIIFPIEDHRGRVVGFGGRILGEGEPKYLNSPETPLFHKGSELYGLHRARREIGAQNRSIVVEGYMDVISLAQFTVENVVATLGTATTRTHIQRLFRLAPEIVFCFDGDRAGRDAGWKALQVALPEMQDGRQVGFLFLPEGEDPDTIVRSEGSDAFNQRVDQATPLPDFLFDSLVSQVDMSRMDGKARLVSLVKPLLAQFPRGALRDMMYSRLSAISGLSESQLGSREASLQTRTGRKRSSRSPLDSGQVSPLALATSMLLQNPELGNAIEESDQVNGLDIQGAEVLIKICELVRAHPDLSTARLLESFRDSSYHSYLEKLAVRPNMIDEDALEQQFRDTLHTLLDRQKSARREELLEKSRLKTLQQDEKVELVELLNERITTT